MYSIFLADTFSVDDSGLFGRAFANRRLLTALLLCEEIRAIYTTSPSSLFSSLTHPDLCFKKIIQLSSLAEVDSIFDDNRIDAVLCSDYVANYSGWIHYRNARHLDTAVFGFTHSLSYQRFTSGIYRILCAGPSLRDGILCTSTCAEEVLGRLFAQVQATLNFPTIPPALLRFPLPYQQKQETVEGCRKSSPFQVLFVGRLDWQTKADLLVLRSIIPKLSKELDIRFVVAGEPGNEAYMMLLQRELEPLGVVLKLSISEEEKHRLYDESHLFFSPSDNYQETFGLTIIEAMGHGCVPLVTDFDGYRDLVREGIGVRLKTVAAHIPPGIFALQGIVSEGTYQGWWAAGVSFDPQDAVRQIEILARDRSLLERMSSAAKESAAEYSLERTAKRFSTLLRRLGDAVDGEPGGEPTPSHNPFIWSLTELFSTHPTELWGEQSVTLTREGIGYLTTPEDLPQFILLSHAVNIADLRKFLFLVKRGYDVRECLKRGVEPIVMSLSLKNGLITLEDAGARHAVPLHESYRHDPHLIQAQTVAIPKSWNREETRESAVGRNPSGETDSATGVDFEKMGCLVAA